MSQSPGLNAAKALVDAAIEYDKSVLQDSNLADTVVHAVNSVLSKVTKYGNEGSRLKPHVEKYLEEKKNEE